MMTRKLEEINSDKFRKPFGALVDPLKTNSKFQVMYFPIFVLRRICFCLLCFYFHDNQVYQIFWLILINYVFSFYIGFFSPKADKIYNSLEIINEYFV